MGQKIDAGGMKDGLTVIDMLVDSPYDGEIHREETRDQIC